MSTKYGSEERGRDPDSPDTLAERLASERDRRAAAREQSAREIHLNTPVSAAPVTEPSAARGPDTTNPSARKVLQMEYQPTFPPGSPQAAGKPPSTPEPAQEWEGLMDMEHKEFIDYMIKRGVKEDLLTFMKEMGMDGPHWRMAISDANSTQVKENIEEQIKQWAGGKSSMAVVMKITMDSKLAFEKWLASKLYQQSTTPTTTNGPLSLKDLHSIKMPELPAGNGLQGRISSEQLKAYIDSLQAIFNLIDKEFSNRLAAIFKSPTAEVLAIVLKDMTARSMQLDQLVGKTFMLRSDEKTIATLISMKRHLDSNNTVSGLRIIQYMGEATTQLTGARLTDLLLKVFAPLTNIPSEISLLEPQYKIHNEALTSLESLDIDLHPVIRCFLLQQMASKLAAKQEHQLILGIPMASIIKSGYEDLAAMTAILESAIIEASNDPKSSKPTVKTDRESKLEKQLAAVTAALKKMEPSDQICVYNRESSHSGCKCIDKDCKRKHIDSGKTCTKPAYGVYGRCEDYFTTCTDRHPWHEAARDKFGSPQLAWQALKATLKPPKKRKGGKAYPIIMLDMSDDERTVTESDNEEEISLLSVSDEEEFNYLAPAGNDLEPPNCDLEPMADSAIIDIMSDSSSEGAPLEPEQADFVGNVGFKPEDVVMPNPADMSNAELLRNGMDLFILGPPEFILGLPYAR